MLLEVLVIWMIVSRVPLAITFGNTRIDALRSVVTFATAGLAAIPKPTSVASPMSPISPRCLRITLLLSITPHRIRLGEPLDQVSALYPRGQKLSSQKAPFFTQSLRGQVNEIALGSAAVEMQVESRRSRP